MTDILAYLASFALGLIFGHSLQFWRPRRHGLRPDWQPPRRNPEPQVANWDAVRDAATRGDLRPLGEFEPHTPTDGSER